MTKSKNRTYFQLFVFKPFSNVYISDTIVSMHDILDQHHQHTNQKSKDNYGKNEFF
jgi:hypothetical protein